MVTEPRRLALRLRQVRLEALGIASYELIAATGGSLPRFTAGSHIDLHLPDAMMRSYSLLNDPDERHRYVIAVQLDRDGRGGSRWLHAVPRVGDLLTADEPVNDFGLDESASASVFIAGGIGITPILSMLQRLNRLGKRWELHYAARSRREAGFVDDLQALASDAGQLIVRFGDEGGERLDLKHIVAEAAADAHLYCCGPARMIDQFVGLCEGRPAPQVHVERFGASSEAATGGGFEVVLAGSGRRIAIDAGKTILDALLDEGVSVQYACSVGVCGTCQTGVIDGIPDHRDDFLSDDEKRSNQTIMICCSGSRSKSLVLDL